MIGVLLSGGLGYDSVGDGTGFFQIIELHCDRYLTNRNYYVSLRYLLTHGKDISV